MPDPTPLQQLAALGSQNATVRELRRHLVGGMQVERECAQDAARQADSSTRATRLAFLALSDVYLRSSNIWGDALREFDQAVDAAGERHA